MTQPPSGSDPFFVLRDCRELYQRRLVEIVRQTGVTDPPSIDAFSSAVGTTHDELASAAQQDGFGQTAGLTASRISLVGNDDLELDIRIGEVFNHLRDNSRIDHWRVQLRYMNLLHRPKMSAEDNPVGLEPICRGLSALCKIGNIPLDQRLERLTRLEELLHLKLPEVYVELNELLGRHRIEPAPAQVVHRGIGGGDASFAGGGTRGPTAACEPPGGLPGGGRWGNTDGYGQEVLSGGPDVLAILQQAMQRQAAIGSPSFSPLAPTNGTIQPATTGGIVLDANTLHRLSELLERLSTLGNQAPAHSTPMPGAIAAQPALRALRSKDVDIPLGQPASIALDTLSLIFDSLLATPELPDVVKASIGRLQIPLLKIAILDASFFSETHHPARQIINRIAHLALGLPRDCSGDHPLCTRITTLANKVRMSLESSNGETLEPHLSELDQLIGEYEEAIDEAAQPGIRIVTSHEESEAAARSAGDWLDTTLSRTRIPAVRVFLATYWQRVMQAACLIGGRDGAIWKENDKVIDELLWSFEPKPTAEERKQLLTLIPTLLKRINTGLDRIDVPSDERKPFFDRCFELQTAVLRGRPELDDAQYSPAASAPGETPAKTKEEPPEKPLPCILEKDGFRVHYLTVPDIRSADWQSRSRYPWKSGDWIGITLLDGTALRGRCCWQSPTTATVLLFNKEWDHSVAAPAMWLEQQFKEGQARILSGQPLFDEAARRALDQYQANR